MRTRSPQSGTSGMNDRTASDVSTVPSAARAAMHAATNCFAIDPT